MSRSALILVCIICIVFFPLVNAESVNTDQEISETTELICSIKHFTNNFTSGKETPGLDSFSSNEGILQIPPAVKKYELVTFDQQGINTGLRSTSPQISFQINGTEYPTDLKRMDFESIDDGIDSFSGTLAGEADSSVLLTVSDNATIGSITLNDETYYIEPVQTKTQTKITERIPHIIYSSRDVENQEFLIDNGPINSNDNEPDAGYRSGTTNSGIKSIQSTDAVPDGRTPVTVLIVTDNQFYSDHSGYGWKIVAQDIIAEANRQFGRDDIGVILIPVYNDSKRQDLTNNQLIHTDPFKAFTTVYPISSLNTYSADLGLYLGGYDKTTGDDQGSSDGYGNVSQPHYGRYSWAQMVADDPFYLATTKGRRVISIHELGHQFGAHHDDADTNPYLDTPGYNRAFEWGIPLTHQTVMWHYYLETASSYEFSSSSPGYHGDTMHDNARRIRETKGNVTRYASCSASLPSADFHWDPAGSPPVWQLITFTIDNPVNNPNYYYWDFGDGSNSSLETPQWAYNWAGTYTVRLTAGNCAGSSTASKDITITPVSSYLSFSGTPQSGSAPLKVYLSSKGTTPTPTSYNWSLGDGNYSSDPNPQHTYYENGTYTVTLTVIQDGVPSTKIMQNYITIEPHVPDASFTSFINSGSAPLYIQFNDMSINNPTSWNWNFDDGMMFNTTNPLEKNVSHTFATARTYNVTLTATNTLGSSTAYQLITATNVPPPTNTSPFEKASAGSYTYTSPVGRNSITITIVGAGGGGGGGTYDSVSYTGNGGYGGNASQVNTITQIVSPGSVIPVYIGSKGSGGKGQCGQINGNPGSNGGYSSVGNVIASGGLGGTGGIYSPTTSHWNGSPGQDGYGTGQYATSGYTSGEIFGGAGGIGKGAGGGGAGGGCDNYAFGGNGADGYVRIEPNFIPPPLADFSASPTHGSTPLTVRFTDTSDGEPTGRVWYFGDETYTSAWTRATASAGWSARNGHTSVAMPDGSIVLMGGDNGSTGTLRDVWRSTNYGATWTQMTASAGWPKRKFHTSVAMPDGSIVLMGGLDDLTIRNDVWRSTNNGVNWTRKTASAGWQGRYGHTSVAMPDGSIVLMGGSDISNVKNDVWRSTDNGATWTQRTASAGWSARNGHTSVAMPDGSIVLMGGNDGVSVLNDVWRSTDNGATWTQVNASAEWSARTGHTSVAMPDGSIVLMGGDDDNPGDLRDIWRSKDNGASWTRVTANAGWSARDGHTSVVVPDGGIVLMGGNDGSNNLNDVWCFTSAGSSVQNPSHTYNTPGTYPVALQVYNLNAFNSTRKARYIHVGMEDKIGVYRNWTHAFYLDYNGNGIWNGTTIDRQYSNFGAYGDTPIAGDWNGDGITEIGVFRNSTHRFLLDYNGNEILEDPPNDLNYNFGAFDDNPVVGDWDGDGITEIGVFRNSTHRFILDSNSNGILENSSIDRRINFGTYNDIPVSGDWNNDGESEVGVFRNSTHTWYLDLDGNGSMDTGEGPFVFGNPGDIPVTGDWNGNGVSDIGIFRKTTGRFLLDYDEDENWTAAYDKNYLFLSGNYSVSGKW